MYNWINAVLRFAFPLFLSLVPLEQPWYLSVDNEQKGAPEVSRRTKIFIAGDSTAANGVPEAIGWGRMLGKFFDVPVINKARGGASSRTFYKGESYQELIAQLEGDDIVLIQFGHNDGGLINGPRVARGSLPGIDQQTKSIHNRITDQDEMVHSYGWYLKRMIHDVREKKAIPILVSLTVRNIWQDGKVERGSGNYRKWSRQIAELTGVSYIDLTKLIADQYEVMGETEVSLFFPKDHTHTSTEGAEFNAQQVIIGLKGLREQSIVQLLSDKGVGLPTAEPNAVLTYSPKHNRADPVERYRWLNLGIPANEALPNLVLIGDSTVRNGRGDGSNGQYGWGDPLAAYFNPAKINVVNRAVGGLGARTFRKTRNYRDVLAMLKHGDTVLIQFGHNDNGPTGPIRGVGDETEHRPVKGNEEEKELTHSYGWYLRQYVKDIRHTGATPIICSLVPRNMWRDGKIVRSENSHADWARLTAEKEAVGFIDLHEIIAKKYDEMGRESVTEHFADVRVHTNWAGAKINAAAVIEGLETLDLNPVSQFYRAKD